MKSQIKIVLVIVVLGVGYTGYEFYDFYTTAVPAMADARQKKEGEVQQYQTQLRRLKEFAQNIEQIKRELRELTLQLSNVLEYMPRNINLAALLRRMSMVAQNSGLELSSFRPSGEEEPKKEGTFYASSMIEIEMKGGFTQTLTFFDQLSRLKRIVNVEMVSMRPERDTSNLSASPKIMTNALARTYRFAE